MKNTNEKTVNIDKKLQKYMDELWGSSGDENESLNKQLKKENEKNKDKNRKNKRSNKYSDKKKHITHDLKKNEKRDNPIDKIISKKENNNQHTICKKEKIKEGNKKDDKSKNHLNINNNAYEKKFSKLNVSQKETSSTSNTPSKNLNKKNNGKIVFENKKQNTSDESKKKEIYEEKKKLENVFMDTIHEIRKLSLPFLNKFQRKIVENHQIKKLGGKFDKSRKIHYPELMHRKKSIKKYILKRKEKEKILGVQIQSGIYSDMQDVFRKKKKEKKKFKMKKLF